MHLIIITPDVLQEEPDQQTQLNKLMDEIQPMIKPELLPGESIADEVVCWTNQMKAATEDDNIVLVITPVLGPDDVDDLYVYIRGFSEVPMTLLKSALLGERVPGVENFVGEVLDQTVTIVAQGINMNPEQFWELEDPNNPEHIPMLIKFPAVERGVVFNHYIRSYQIKTPPDLKPLRIH